MLIEEDDCRDTFLWKEEPSGTFSVSSAYNLVHVNTGNEDDITWTNIWKMKVPNKMRVFLWLAYHQKIMSNEIRKKKGFTNQDSCHRCNGIVEDVGHILRWCPNAEDVWRRVAPSEYASSGWSKPLTDWLGENVRSARKSLWSEKFMVVAWWLWRWRNEEVFKEDYKTTEQKVK